MRQFWANQFDFNDRNDFPAATRTNPGNPRPTGSLVDEFAFGDVRATGPASPTSAPTWAGQRRRRPPRFGIAVAQQLCFYANSSPCSESDAEFRRIVGAFRDSNFNYGALMKEFFASPIVTGAAATGSFPPAGPDQHARRDHLCTALSNRLGKPDLCAQALAAHLGATSTATHRGQRRSRRLQPWRPVAGDADRADAVLPGRDRDVVREHRHPGGRRRIAAVYPSSDIPARSTRWSRP